MTKLNPGLLATLGPLRSLTEVQIDELRPHLRDVKVSQGDQVFREGEPGNALFIIVEGAGRGVEGVQRWRAGPRHRS